MRVPRIYSPQPLAPTQSVLLELSVSKHLLSVLRLKPGALVKVFDGAGREFEACLVGIEKHRARVLIKSEIQNRSESPLKIILAQGISRGERMDFTLQKSVELGVAEIMPVMTERSVVRLDEGNATRKQHHWQQTIISACEQSGRAQLPALHAPISLQGLLAKHFNAQKLLLDPEARGSLHALERPMNASVLLLVGPEGGLSDAEREAASHAGFLGVRLGPRILRTETAALVALSLLQDRWGDLGS